MGDEIAIALKHVFEYTEREYEDKYGKSAEHEDYLEKNATLVKKFNWQCLMGYCR